MHEVGAPGLLSGAGLSPPKGPPEARGGPVLAESEQPRWPGAAEPADNEEEGADFGR